MNKLINQTHVHLISEGYQLFGKVTKHCNTVYKTVVVKHSRGGFIRNMLKHVYIDDVIACFDKMTPHLAKDNDKQKQLFIKLKQMIIDNNGYLPNTSDEWASKYGEREKHIPSKRYNKDKLREKQQRRLNFLLKWEAMKDKLWTNYKEQ